VKFLSCIANLHKIGGDYAKAIEIYQEAILCTDILANKEIEAVLHHNQGETYHIIGKNKEALTYSAKGYFLATEIKLKNVDDYHSLLESVLKACPQKLIAEVEKELNCSLHQLRLE